MAARPRDAAATRGRILDAARELFASRGYHGTSIRQIAARAEVDHALVLRYFGNKEQLLNILLQDESLGFRGTSELGTDEEDALQGMSRMLTTALTDGRQVMRLLLRAELDDVTPEWPFEDRKLPIGLLADWLEAHGASESGVDPRAFAMLVGATGFGLVAAEPLLMSAVGWQDEEPDEVRRKCIEAQVALIGLLLGKPGA